MSTQRTSAELIHLKGIEFSLKLDDWDTVVKITIEKDGKKRSYSSDTIPRKSKIEWKKDMYFSKDSKISFEVLQIKPILRSTFARFGVEKDTINNHSPGEIIVDQTGGDSGMKAKIFLGENFVNNSKLNIALTLRPKKEDWKHNSDIEPVFSIGEEGERCTLKIQKLSDAYPMWIGILNLSPDPSPSPVKLNVELRDKDQGGKEGQKNVYAIQGIPNTSEKELLNGKKYISTSDLKDYPHNSVATVEFELSLIPTLSPIPTNGNFLATYGSRLRMLMYLRDIQASLKSMSETDSKDLTTGAIEKLGEKLEEDIQVHDAILGLTIALKVGLDSESAVTANDRNSKEDVPKPKDDIINTTKEILDFLVDYASKLPRRDLTPEQNMSLVRFKAVNWMDWGTRV